MVDTIEHYGIKGMRWGVRRTDAQLARASSETSSKSKGKSSDDAKSADAAKTKASTQGLQSLSNKELKTLNERMNLERQYSQLSTQTSTVKKGEERVKSVLSVAKTASEIYNVVNSPMMQEVQKILGLTNNPNKQMRLFN